MGVMGDHLHTGWCLSLLCTVCLCASVCACAPMYCVHLCCGAVQMCACANVCACVLVAAKYLTMALSPCEGCFQTENDFETTDQTI